MIKEKILVFVPAYNCETQISRVLDQLEQEWVAKSISKVIVVENQSTDKTAIVVKERIGKRGDNFIELLRNKNNYGLGGSHKVAFQYASKNQFDWIVVLHGDDQGALLDFKSSIEKSNETVEDAVLGSRFMRGALLYGYSKIRIYGNIIFNLIYSACLGRKISDLGAGLNMYRVSSLQREQYIKYPDNLTFNCVLLCSQIINKNSIRFEPISWREDDQVSSVKLIRQSFQTLKIAVKSLFFRNSFSNNEYRELIIKSYDWSEEDA